MFDTVVRHDAAFEVLEFRIGRTNDEPSFVSMRVTSRTAGRLTGVLEELVALGCRVAGGEDAHVRRRPRRLRARGLLLHHQPSDVRARSAASGWRSNSSGWTRRSSSTAAARSAASCARSAPATPIVCGIHGIKIVPEFQERDRLGFAFMTNEISSERRVEVGVARIAAMMRDGETGRRADRLRRRAGGRPHRRRRLLLRSHPPRLRGRAARRQRARRPRRRAGALRHVARRRHGERTRDRRRPSPPHARDQRDLSRRRPARRGRAAAC